MAYTDAIEFTQPAIEFANNYVARGVGGFNDGVEVTPTFELADNYVSRGTTSFNDGVVITPADILLGEFYVHTRGQGLFVGGTELWIWRLDGNGDNTISTETGFDLMPPHLPYTKNFYPSFELTVGKTLDFTATPRYGMVPLKVQFTDLCPPIVLQWFWDFGDGYYSLEQHPRHTYKRPGFYGVILRVRVGKSFYYVRKLIEFQGI